MLCEPWLLALLYAGEWKDKTILSLIWFIETVSEVSDVAASSALEENLDSVKEEVASAAQEISDTSSRSQDVDAEESGQTSEGARVQRGLKCFVSESANGCLHWTSCESMQNLSDAMWLLVITVFGIIVLAEDLISKLYAMQ